VWPSKAAVGDEIRLFFQVKHPQGHSLKPLSEDVSLSPFELKAVKIVPEEAGLSDTVMLTLTVFNWGEQTVPAVTLTYRDGTGKEIEVQSKPVKVQVTEVPRRPTDKGDIRPVKGPVSLDISGTRNLIFAWAAAILGIFLAVKIGLRRRRRMPDPESLLAAHERALRELERLKRNDFLVQGKVKEHYSELADVLRRYLERGFEAQALERTTAEVVSQLETRGMGRDAIGNIRRLLENTDLVKFAKFAPPPSLAGDLERLLLVIVNMTKPAEPRPDSGAR
jgi:hypothetical protein